jgi:regulator of replication initiation timing
MSEETTDEKNIVKLRKELEDLKQQLQAATQSNAILSTVIRVQAKVLGG